MKSFKIGALLLSLMCLTACDYTQKKEFRTERAERLYRAAMADYSAGRMDAAIIGFKKAIRSNPANASARFQLACLLQDQKQDYLGALCCYREYLLLEAGGDKETMAKNRASICEKLLASELAKKMNLTDGTTASKGLVEARREAEEASARLAQAEQRVAEIEKKNQALLQENARLRRMLSSIGEESSSSQKMDVSAAKEILADAESDRLKLSPDARALFEEEESAEAPEIAESARRAEAGESSDGPSLLTRPEGEEAYKGPKLSEMRETTSRPAKAEPPHEPRPEFYVVQEGDTLYRIALRFYGRRDAWRKILEANKATVSSDARIRTGQKLRLP